MCKEIRKIRRKQKVAYKKAKGKPHDHPEWENHRLCREKKRAIAKAKEKRFNTLTQKINGGNSSEKELWMFTNQEQILRVHP